MVLNHGRATVYGQVGGDVMASGEVHIDGEVLGDVVDLGDAKITLGPKAKIHGAVRKDEDDDLGD